MEPARGARGSDRSGLVRVAPWLFILIWSSGYVVAKLASPHADPLTFLLVRYAGVILVMGALAAAARAPWPSWRQAGHIAVAGICIQAGYLGCVWVAVAQGTPAGVVALIVNLQPVLTAVAGPLVGERVGRTQWLGLALGFAGVALVVSTKLGAGAGAGAGMTMGSVALSVVALLSMTAGTLYQKRFCPAFDLRTGQLVQFAASFLVTLPFALAGEELRIEWTPEVVGALLWSVFVLTGAGISLLFIMIRHGAATRVTSYLYLVPPVTAIMAWLMFGEVFQPIAAAGMALTIAGVALVVARRS
jgi:drug/metabolite transporter (DMT)-like permease